MDMAQYEHYLTSNITHRILMSDPESWWDTNGNVDVNELVEDWAYDSGYQQPPGMPASMPHQNHAVWTIARAVAERYSRQNYGKVS